MVEAEIGASVQLLPFKELTHCDRVHRSAPIGGVYSTTVYVSPRGTSAPSWAWRTFEPHSDGAFETCGTSASSHRRHSQNEPTCIGRTCLVWNVASGRRDST